MYIVRTKRKYDGKKGEKIFTAVFLRESYREDGKVKGRTIANLSHLSPAVIDALDLVFKREGDLTDIIHLKDTLTLHEGKSVGGLLLLSKLAKDTGIIAALGASREGQLALWQVMARTLEQGSRLSSVRLAQHCAVGEVLGLREGFTEYDLYDNLTWLCKNQDKIEDALFAARGKGKVTLCLYDVTSVYLEGTENELAAFGYNRDKKEGKMQIVVGLLCDDLGIPLSVQVFEGNTPDGNTVADQIRKVADRFGATEVVFVGDRAMVKAPIQELLTMENFRFITALTKPQVRTKIETGVIQMSLFENQLCEVQDGNRRLILRRSPVRAEEMAATRESKYTRAVAKVTKENSYLRDHPKADPAKAQERIRAYTIKLHMHDWTVLTQTNRTLSLTIDAQARSMDAELDGCYVLASDVPAASMDTTTIHDRYKDLALVEQAFRTSKQSCLEVQPVFVQTEENTRGHLFVTMLSYMLIRRLQQLWSAENCTVPEGLASIGTLSLIDVRCKGETVFCRIPEPRPLSLSLLQKAGVTIPQTLQRSTIRVVTKKLLQKERRMASAKGKS